MSHSTKIVPSRDALRALRTLAFSPQAAFVAATGSVCGLVAVHHHQRRKLRLAEKILETKRTIHVLSQGRGNAQATRMFEAAEKGEDFTLHHGRPSRPRRKRRYSTDVGARPAEEEIFSHPWNQLDGHVDESSQQDPLRQPFSSDTPFEDGIQDTRLEYESKTGDLAVVTNSADDNTRPSYSPRVARQITVAHELWKMKRHKTQIPGYWSETVELAKQRLRGRWSQQSDRTRTESDPDLGHSNPLIKQTITDLNPVPLTPVALLNGTVAGASLGLSTEESVFFNFVFGKPLPDSIFETNIFRSMQPWSADFSTEYREYSESLGENRRDDSLNLSVPNILPYPTSATSNDKHIAGTSNSKIKSKFGPTDVEKRLKRADCADHYYAIFNAIARVFETDGERAARLLLEHHLAMHYSSKRWNEYGLATTLVSDVRQFITYESFSLAVRNTVRDELSRDVPNLDVVRLLYPAFKLCQSDDRPADYYFLVKEYIQEYCKDVYDPEEQISELLKLLDASVQLLIPPCEHMVVPVLRQLTKAGHVTRAHELLDTVTIKYNIQTSFYSTAEIMRGYTVAGEWPKARALMEKAHAQDLSWKAVHGYSAMLGGTIDQYANSYPPDKVYKFVEYCMAEYALLPTRVVSSRLLRVCLRARRYDLVREWVLKIQRDFNFLSSGIGSQTFASEVGLLWREVNASCIDVLASVRALSVGAVENPFANTFKGIVAEAVQRDLSKRLKALERLTTCKLPERRVIEDVRVLVEDVKSLIAHAFKSGFIPRTRLMADDLLQQVKAVMDIDHVFSGNYETQQELTWEERHPSKDTALAASPFSGMPHTLRVARLPRIKSVIIIVEKAYQAEARRKHKPSEARFHDILRYTVDRLEKQQRHSDAYALMEAVYNSKLTSPGSGVPFDADLFTTWLKLAVALMSGTKYRAVLWNVLDAGPEVHVTTELVLVARVGAHRTHDSRFRRGNDLSVIETEYLRARLRRRKFLQGGTLLKLSGWKGVHDHSVERFMEMEARITVADDVTL